MPVVNTELINNVELVELRRKWMEVWKLNNDVTFNQQIPYLFKLCVNN
jgi:hypothetical protein